MRMKIRGSVVSLSFLFPHPPEDRKKKKKKKCSRAKTSLHTQQSSTAVCIFSGWSASLAGSVARSSINIILLDMQSSCAPVCSAVLWCVFDTTRMYWVQHWYCRSAAPSFSEHTYGIPLRDALWVIFWVKGTLCRTLTP